MTELDEIISKIYALNISRWDLVDSQTQVTIYSLTNSVIQLFIQWICMKNIFGALRTYR